MALEATGDARLVPLLAMAACDPEEAAWLGRAREGDPRAFGWLLTRYRDRVVRLAAHVLRNPDEAEDAAQEAFVRAFRGLRGYSGRSSFYTWLYHIAVRVCLDRRKLRRWTAETPLADELAGGPREVAADRLVVEALLDRLSPPMRAALVLREMDGLEYGEIAEVLDIPMGTVRSRLSAARAQFRELYQAANEEAERV